MLIPPLSNTKDTSDKITNENEETKIELPSKHVISLTLENYLLYFDISTIVTAAASVKTSSTIKSCLSYAYYDNVIFTFQYTGAANPSQLKIVYNTARNGRDSFSGRANSSIISVTETVTY